jgi:hypothetical protein
MYVPATQVVQSVQAVTFVVVLYVPLSHALHVRSVDAVPAASIFVPAGQFVHAVQLAALVVALYVLDSQAVQV